MTSDKLIIYLAECNAINGKTLYWERRQGQTRWRSTWNPAVIPFIPFFLVEVRKVWEKRAVPVSFKALWRLKSFYTAVSCSGPDRPDDLRFAGSMQPAWWRQTADHAGPLHSTAGISLVSLSFFREQGGQPRPWKCDLIFIFQLRYLSKVTWKNLIRSRRHVRRCEHYCDNFRIVYW